MNTILLKDEVYMPLNEQSLAHYLTEFKKELIGKVDQVWLFGSSARGDYHQESDIDIALVQETDTTFVKRPFAFTKLLDIYPRTDILVYTPEEFERQLLRKDQFWENFKKDAVRLI